MTTTLPSIEEIQSAAESKGMIAIKAGVCDIDRAAVNVDPDQPDILNQFLTLASTLEANTFFYNIAYLNDKLLDGLKIYPEEVTKESYGALYSAMVNKVNEHNEAVSQLPKDAPASVALFFIGRGVMYSLEFVTDWSKELMSPDDALDMIYEKVEQEYSSHKATKQVAKTHLKALN